MREYVRVAAKTRAGEVVRGQQWQIAVTVACSLTIVAILVGVLVSVVKRKRATTWYPDGYQLNTVSGISALSSDRYCINTNVFMGLIFVNFVRIYEILCHTLRVYDCLFGNSVYTKISIYELGNGPAYTKFAMYENCVYTVYMYYECLYTLPLCAVPTCCTLLHVTEAGGGVVVDVQCGAVMLCLLQYATDRSNCSSKGRAQRFRDDG